MRSIRVSDSEFRPTKLTTSSSDGGSVVAVGVVACEDVLPEDAAPFPHAQLTFGVVQSTLVCPSLPPWAGP